MSELAETKFNYRLCGSISCLCACFAFVLLTHLLIPFGFAELESVRVVDAVVRVGLLRAFAPHWLVAGLLDSFLLTIKMLSQTLRIARFGRGHTWSLWCKLQW